MQHRPCSLLQFHMPWAEPCRDQLKLLDFVSDDEAGKRGRV